MSELLLVSVPGVRLTGAGALLRVLMVPRLSGAGTSLADYGMAHWPLALATAGPLQVRLRTSTGDDLAVVEVAARHDAQAEVWDAFFGSAAVVPYTGATTYPSTSVAPTGDHAEQIDRAYAAAVTAVGDPAEVELQLGALRLEPPPPAPDPTAPVPRAVDPDFHRIVSLMRQHPVVLRALGLIVDLEVPRSALDRCGGTGEISVGWANPPAPFEVITSPATRFVVRGGRFFAAPATRQVVDEATGRSHDVPVDAVVDGMVDLARTTPDTPGSPPRPDWAVHTFDVDAAVARLGDARLAAARVRSRRAPVETDDADDAEDAESAESGETVGAGEAPAVMPALRTVGLQLVHRTRGEWVARRQSRAATNAANAATARNAAETSASIATLTADDLVLGYRLDVRLTGAGWHSMMSRQSSYTVDDVPIAGGWLSEESHLPSSAGVRATDDTVHSDGVVARWSGHRLSLPPPAPEARARRADVVRQGPYRFAWEHRLDPDEPASRPELRFGESYQLRLRAVDLAGGGLEVADVAGATSASPDTVYARHEPVLPPEMPPPAGLLELSSDRDGRRRSGVDPDVLGPGGSLARLVVRSDPAGAGGPVGPADLADVYPANDSRMLLPPAASFSLAEWDGRLDGDDAEAWSLARRALAPPRASSESRAGRHYTWVPDPAADSVSVTVLPLAADLESTPPSVSDWDAASWPDHAPKEVRLVAGAPGDPRQPSLNWQTSVTAEVSLPPAGHAVVEVASAIRSSYFTRFAAAGWAASGLPLDAVVTGRHPVITPALRLEVVHAVRAPLSAPGGTLEALREPGGLSAVLHDPRARLLGIDRDSTAQLDVVATWQEWTDAAEPTPVTQAVGSISVDRDATFLHPIEHRFGDTHHRLITYRLAARSRFRDYFAATDPESSFVRETEMAPVHVPSTVRPTAPVVLSVTAATRTVVTPDATTVVRREGGILRVELAGPWFTTGEGEQLGVVVSPGADPAAIEREDEGFEWSGDEESGEPRPPVVDPHVVDTTHAHAALVTRTYRDPLLPDAVPAQPVASSLTGTGGPPLVLRYAESGVLLCIVPFDVVRIDGRWFADIGFADLADSAAVPLVQLALVRFQRHSLAMLKASPVVTTDLVATLPSRELRVEIVEGRRVVTLAGPDDAHGQVELRLESAPAGTAVTGLTSLDPEVPGWTTVWQVDTAAVNVASEPFDVPQDGRSHRLVVRELDPVPARTDPPVTGALEQAQSRLARFVGVVEL